MWEGLKFNLTKLFNHLLVDNVSHLLVNHLNDLHVSLLVQYHYFRRNRVATVGATAGQIWLFCVCFSFVLTNDPETHDARSNNNEQNGRRQLGSTFSCLVRFAEHRGDLETYFWVRFFVVK